MTKKIAVQTGLSNIENYLSSKGYKVESVDYGMDYTDYNPDQYAAVVITGQNKDFIGMQDTLTKAVVINADGLTPQEVYSQLQSRIQ